MHPLESVHFDLELKQDLEFDVVGMGLNAVDWIVKLPCYPDRNSKIQIEDFKRLPGGQVATAMALCGRYGLSVRYLGRVGDDEVGRFSLSSLKTEPVDISLVEVIPGAASQYAIILVDPGGQRTVLWDRDPELAYAADNIPLEWVACGNILHLDGHDEEAAIHCAQHAVQAGMKTCLDVDKVQSRTSKLLALTDFALPSENFVREFTGIADWRKALLEVDETVRGFTAITRDFRGCAAVWEGEIYEIPSFPVNAVDGTGAGDVFHGAFIYALCRGWNLWRCLRFSNAAGALACRRVGSRSGIPNLKEVEALLNED